LEGNFSYLDQGNKKVGRVALLKKAGALFDDQAKVLYSLAELRNSVAHDVKNTNFNFDEYIAKLDKNQKVKFVNEFGSGVKDEIIFDDIVVTKNTFVQENPKLSIWLTCHEIIACLYMEIQITDIDTKIGSLSGLKNLTNHAKRAPQGGASS
jgi:hypothetical protein